MAKSQINSMSKRQILESLYQEQNQSNVTLSRLIIAVARAADLDPQKLADLFVDDKGNQDYVEKFNVAVKEKHAAMRAESALSLDDTESTGFTETDTAGDADVESEVPVPTPTTED